MRAPKIADEERRARELATRSAELERLQAEHERVGDDRKPALRRVIEGLRARLEPRLERDRLWREQLSEQMHAKARARPAVPDRPAAPTG